MLNALGNGRRVWTHARATARWRSNQLRHRAPKVRKKYFSTNWRPLQNNTNKMQYEIVGWFRATNSGRIWGMHWASTQDTEATSASLLRRSALRCSESYAPQTLKFWNVFDLSGQFGFRPAGECPGVRLEGLEIKKEMWSCWLRKL